MNRLTESMQPRSTNSANSVERYEFEDDYEQESYAMHVDKPMRKIQYVHNVLLLRVNFFVVASLYFDIPMQTELL